MATLSAVANLAGVGRDEVDDSGDDGLELPDPVLSAKEDIIAFVSATTAGIQMLAPSIRAFIKNMKRNDAIEERIATLGALSTLDEVQDAHLADAREKHKGLGVVKKVVKWAIKKIVKWALKKAVMFVGDLLFTVVRQILVRGVLLLSEFLVEPALAAILGFVGLNVELWPVLAIAAGVAGFAGLGYYIYDKFFSKKEPTGTVDPSTVGIIESIQNKVAGLAGTPVAAAPQPAGQPLATTTSPAEDSSTAVRQVPSSDAMNRSAARKLSKRSEDVDEAIRYASSTVGVPYGILTGIAAQESTFNPNAGASTSSAKGLFQFLVGGKYDTWGYMLRKYGAQFGLSTSTSPYDTRASALMGAAYIKYEIYPAISRVVPQPSATDLYFGHFLGPGSGAQFLQNMIRDPSRAAYLDFPKPAASNIPVFYKTVAGTLVPRSYAEIYAMFSGQIESVSNLATSMQNNGQAVNQHFNPVDGVIHAPSMTQTQQNAATVAMRQQPTGSARAETPNTIIRAPDGNTYALNL